MPTQLTQDIVAAINQKRPIWEAARRVFVLLPSKRLFWTDGFLVDFLAGLSARKTQGVFLSWTSSLTTCSDDVVVTSNFSDKLFTQKDGRPICPELFFMKQTDTLLNLLEFKLTEEPDQYKDITILVPDVHHPGIQTIVGYCLRIGIVLRLYALADKLQGEAGYVDSGVTTQLRPFEYANIHVCEKVFVQTATVEQAFNKCTKRVSWEWMDKFAVTGEFSQPDAINCILEEMFETDTGGSKNG